MINTSMSYLLDFMHLSQHQFSAYHLSSDDYFGKSCISKVHNFLFQKLIDRAMSSQLREEKKNTTVFQSIGSHRNYFIQGICYKVLFMLSEKQNHKHKYQKSKKDEKIQSKMKIISKNDRTIKFEEKNFLRTLEKQNMMNVFDMQLKLMPTGLLQSYEKEKAAPRLIMKSKIFPPHESSTLKQFRKYQMLLSFYKEATSQNFNWNNAMQYRSLQEILWKENNPVFFKETKQKIKKFQHSSEKVKLFRHVFLTELIAHMITNQFGRSRGKEDRERQGSLSHEYMEEELGELKKEEKSEEEEKYTRKKRQKRSKRQKSSNISKFTNEKNYNKKFLKNCFNQLKKTALKEKNLMKKQLNKLNDYLTQRSKENLKLRIRKQREEKIIPEKFLKLAANRDQKIDFRWENWNLYRQWGSKQSKKQKMGQIRALSTYRWGMKENKPVSSGSIEGQRTFCNDFHD